MTIFRNPVEGAFIPHALACLDVDPDTGLRRGEKCRSQWRKFPRAHSPFFVCPNRSNGVPGKCDSMAFMYPRRRRKSGDKEVDESGFHFHQGVDILAKRGTPIRSVTAGKVLVATKVVKKGYSGYGMVVVIESTVLGKTHWFLYAHNDDVLVSEDEVVAEQQVIATVGTTCFTESEPEARFEDRQSHLHFEVSDKRYSFSAERSPGTPIKDVGRLDPREVLEQLGPWGMSAVYLPWGGKLSRSLADEAHLRIEASPHGGYFPLGANNHWHGGIHLPTPLGSDLVAPFDATIVAARLDPDPAHALADYGHTNFILLRHEISPTYHHLFQGKPLHELDPKPTPTPAKSRAVGRKARCANEPPDVIAVKQRLAAHGYFRAVEPDRLDDPRTSADLWDAIEAFQADEVPGIKPDGVVDIPGQTWTALHDGSPPAEPPTLPSTAEPTATVDPQRTLYCLLMHLQPLPITDALADAFPWLNRVTIPPTAGDPDPAEELARRAREEREQDLAEAKHTLSGAVGAPSDAGEPALNLPDDIHWVHLRLIRHGYHPAPPSTLCTPALVEAIRTLQNDHHPSFKKKRNGDGRVDRTGGTVTLLRKTRDELQSKSTTPAKVDPVFVHRTTVRDEHGTARVLTNLDVQVRSGEPLWRSGQAQGFTTDDSLVLHDQVHWELFSEQLLPATWHDPIEDLDRDLTIDIPVSLLNALESGVPDEWLTLEEVQSLYRSGRGERLRRTPCRFVSQWALDVPASVARLEQLGYVVTDLPQRLRPFMWWDQAAGVLPSTKHVWHYNPLELLADYAEHLASMQPVEYDPATHPTLVVRVRYDDGQPMSKVVVELRRGADVVREERTGADGRAQFRGTEVGDYAVRVKDPATAAHEVSVTPGDPTEVTIDTDVPGPPLPRGTIRALVRDHGFRRAPGIEVWLLHPTHGPLMHDLTRTTNPGEGEVFFEDIPHGDYVIEAGDAPATSVTLAAKRKTVNITLRPPLGTVRVTVTIDGVPAPHQHVELADSSLPPALTPSLAPQRTDHAGQTTFTLRQGRYRVRVGPVTSKRFFVKGNRDDNEHALDLAAAQAPDPHEGTLQVLVYEGEQPLPDQLVRLANLADETIALQYTAPDGLATFVLPPETLTVSAGDVSLTTRVHAHTTTSETLVLEPLDPPEP